MVEDVGSVLDIPEYIHITLDNPAGDDPIEFDMPRDKYMEIARITVDNNMTWFEALECILSKFREAHPEDHSILVEAE
jgi:hypothetical protein